MPWVTGSRAHPTTYLTDPLNVALAARESDRPWAERPVDEWVPTIVDDAADACREMHFVRTSKQGDDNRLTRAVYLRNALQNLVTYSALAIRELDREMGEALDAHERMRHTCADAIDTASAGRVTCVLPVGHDGEHQSATVQADGPYPRYEAVVWDNAPYDEEAEAEAELKAAAERIAALLGNGVEAEAVETALRSAWDEEEADAEG